MDKVRDRVAPFGAASATASLRRAAQEIRDRSPVYLARTRHPHHRFTGRARARTPAVTSSWIQEILIAVITSHDRPPSAPKSFLATSQISDPDSSGVNVAPDISHDRACLDTLFTAAVDATRR